MSFTWPIGPATRPEGYSTDDEASYDYQDSEEEDSDNGDNGVPVDDLSLLFLANKPDIDIFWPQNGWYQVKRRHAYLYTPPSMPLGNAYPVAKLVTAASVPLELYDLILDCLSLDKSKAIGVDASRLFFRSNAVFTKHEMGLCALVCSTWARSCQAKIFNTIILRSRQDLYQIFEFLDSPLSRIHRYIQYIEVSVQKLATPPWLHLLPLLYPRLECQRHNLGVCLEGPLHRSFRSMHSIHYQLPKDSPITFSTHVVQVDLYDVHLRNLKDLLQLIGEMPELSRLICHNVTWSSLPLTIPVKRLAANRSKELQVWMTGCTHNWVAVWLFVGLRRHRRDIPSTDIMHLGDFASTVEASTDAGPEVALRTTVKSTCSGEIVTISHQCTVLGSSQSRSWISMPDTKFQWQRRASPADGFIGHVTRVHLDFWDFPDIEAYWKLIDWGRIDEALGHFEELKELILVFQRADDISDFLNTIIPEHSVLASLSAVNKLKCTVLERGRSGRNLSHSG